LEINQGYTTMHGQSIIKISLTLVYHHVHDVYYCSTAAHLSV